MDRVFEGQAALVTGASRGIGRAVALALAERGAAVAVNYRTGRTGAEDVVARIRADGGRAVAVGGDVAEPEQARDVVERAVAELGGLNVLVNNAGISRDGLFYTMGADDWLDVMRVNFGGVFNCTKAALEHFLPRRRGVVVNVSSVMGERAWIGQANYAASKAAINALTRCAAVELARFGVRVNAVLPGFTPTDLVRGLLARDGGRGVRRQIPMREFAAEGDVANAVVYLAGPGARYLTGALLPVDGGAHIQLGTGAAL